MKKDTIYIIEAIITYKIVCFYKQNNENNLTMLYNTYKRKIYFEGSFKPKKIHSQNE